MKVSLLLSPEAEDSVNKHQVCDFHSLPPFVELHRQRPSVAALTPVLEFLPTVFGGKYIKSLNGHQVEGDDLLSKGWRYPVPELSADTRAVAKSFLQRNS